MIEHHHINGLKTDNHPENLIAYPRVKHDKLISLLLRKIKELQLENKALKAGQVLLPVKSEQELEVM